MQITLISVGTKMPGWVTTACDEYIRRMPASCGVILKEVPAEKRGKNSSDIEICRQEAKRLEAAIPNGDRIVALDNLGKHWSTEKLATRLESWKMDGRNVSLLIGGPDGLLPELRNKADECWSLSELTFPHPLVRVIVAEQLYRAWSITANHPYHRAG